MLPMKRHLLYSFLVNFEEKRETAEGTIVYSCYKSSDSMN